MTANPRSFVENGRERLLEELAEFLRIPSVSTLPEHENDVLRAAASRLRPKRLGGPLTSTSRTASRTARWSLISRCGRVLSRGATPLDLMRSIGLDV